MEENKLIVDNFEFEYSGKVIGLITETEEEIGFHFHPDLKEFFELK